MTRILDLTTEQELELERNARRAGVNVDTYLQQLIQKATTPRSSSPDEAYEPEIIRERIQEVRERFKGLLYTVDELHKDKQDEIDREEEKYMDEFK